MRLISGGWGLRVASGELGERLWGANPLCLLSKGTFLCRPEALLDGDSRSATFAVRRGVGDFLRGVVVARVMPEVRMHVIIIRQRVDLFVPAFIDAFQGSAWSR
jgi:hypothetical protein